MQPNDTHREPQRACSARLVPALILIGIGTFFLLGNLHIVYFQDWLRYWPVLLIAVGIFKLVDSKFADGRIGGGVLVFLGAVFLAQSFGYLSLSWHDLWPVFLIGLGLLMLFRRTLGHGRYRNHGWPPATQVWSSAVLNESAVFGGGKRVVNAQDFQGGQISAVFGGFELDLRQAAMEAATAVLEINTIFGGVEVKVPRHWSAVVEGAGIFGGFADNTIQPDLAQTPGAKRLVVRGSAIFGGVDVKN